MNAVKIAACCMAGCIILLVPPSARAQAEPASREKGEGGKPSREIQAQEEPSRQELKKELEALKKEYDRRLGELELTLELMSAGGGAGPAAQEEGRPEAGAAPSFGVAPGRIGALGQTDRFSRTFNPAVGLVLDTLGTVTTDKASRGKQDRFWLRAPELNLAAHIDPFGYGYAVFEGSEDEGMEVVEAAGVLNRLPANFSLKGGRMLADVTKFGQRHDHELPFVEKPGVLYDYIGGALQGTGLELHQWFGIADTVPIRWSVGAFNELAGHGHDLVHGHHHHHEDESGDLSKRHLDNFSYGGRVTSYMDLDEKDSLQLGASAWLAPEITNHEAAGNFDTRRTVGALDATFKWQDPSSQRAFYLGAEALLSHGQLLHGEGAGMTEDTETSTGAYLWGEYLWNPYWSTGVILDRYQLKQNNDVAQQDYSAFVTWRISHFNWLRFQYRYNDLDRGEGSYGRDYHEFIFQWSIVIGSHAHGLDW